MKIFASRLPCDETSGNGDLRRKGLVWSYQVCLVAAFILISVMA